MHKKDLCLFSYSSYLVLAHKKSWLFFKNYMENFANEKIEKTYSLAGYDIGWKIAGVCNVS